MMSLLLAMIYIAFIGLGLPDSLFGTAWPAIYSEFGLSLSLGGVITSIVYTGTMVSSLSSARVIGRFGTGKVTAFSTVLTAIAILGFSLSGNFLTLCLLAIPLGLGAGAIDTALNNYVSLHYSAAQMSLLHCFYGIGVTVSPFILSLAMQQSGGWRNGYRIAFGIQMGISVLLFLALPLWRKVAAQSGAGQSGETLPEDQFEAIPLREIAWIPGVKVMWCLFFASCAIEGTCNGWSATFLVEQRGQTADAAAGTVLFYFLGMALGRLTSGILATRLPCWKIIRLGQVVLGIALLLLLIPGVPAVTTLALLLIGAGNGPMFPNFNYLTPEAFGPEHSPAVMGVLVPQGAGDLDEGRGMDPGKGL